MVLCYLLSGNLRGRQVIAAGGYQIFHVIGPGYDVVTAGFHWPET